MKYRTVLVNEVVKETTDAFLFQIEEREVWVPKSVVEDAECIMEEDEDVEVEVAEWFADREEL